MKSTAAPTGSPAHEEESASRAHAGLKALIWTYFLLLMTEGILRKWVLPGLSNPLLFVRDPVLLAIYVLALTQGLPLFNGYVIALGIVGICAIIAGQLTGIGTLLVTAYGIDANFLHIPLIFVVPAVLKRSDVVKIGRWFLIIAVPMAVLMTQQFRSPPDAWINCGAGGSTGAQIEAVMGKIRPPGFFTFITGAAQFYAFATAFLIYGMLRKGTYNNALLYSCGLAIMVATAVSTSRLMLGGVAVVFLMIGVIAIFDKAVLNGAARLLLPIGIAFLIATNLDVFHEGTMVFEARLEVTGDVQAGALGAATSWSERTFSDFSTGVLAMGLSPLFGMGLGVGTNVGAVLLSGTVGFLVAEGEWARIILEIGPVLGFLYLAIRIAILIRMGAEAVKSARIGNFLPMLLLGAGGLLVLDGQFRQGTTVGFAVLGAGLCLAANNLPEIAPHKNQPLSSKRKPAPSMRPGRSPHASALHRAALKNSRNGY